MTSLHAGQQMRSSEQGTRQLDAADKARMRVRTIAAAGLFFSGAIIGGALGRLSAWVSPPTRADHTAMTQASPPSAKASADRSAPRATVNGEPAPAPAQAADAKPTAADKPTADTRNIQPNAHPGSQTSPSAPAPSVTLLNPGTAKELSPDPVAKSTKPDRLPRRVDEESNRSGATSPDYKSLRQHALGRRD